MRNVGAQGFEDSANVGVLKGEPELDSEKSEAHVPDLPKVEGGSFAWFHESRGAQRLG